MNILYIIEKKRRAENGLTKDNARLAEMLVILIVRSFVYLK